MLFLVQVLQVSKHCLRIQCCCLCNLEGTVWCTGTLVMDDDDDNDEEEEEDEEEGEEEEEEEEDEEQEGV